ncbi:MAG: hypothetical protein IPO95_06675 [Rhodanobacteraceae bacterium]|nr:hypothetical protein [Rhodanobacteraceae bacterium]
MRIIALTLAAACGLTACSTEAPPADPSVQAERADPKGNPLEGTVLDAQGEALKKARGLEDQMAADAEQRRKEIDAQAQ